MPDEPSAIVPTSSPRWSRLLALLLLVPLLPSCLGDQFGGENGAGDEKTCIDVRRQTFDIDEITPTGFRARDVLDFAVDTFDVPFSLSLPDEGYSGLRLTPEGDTTLHITVASDAKSATYVDRDLGPESPKGTYCPDYLEIPAELNLRTDNGGFDDTLPILLESRHLAVADVAVRLDPGSMQGTFDLAEEDELMVDFPENPPGGWALDEMLLTLSVNPGHVRGDLIAWYEGTHADGEPATARVNLWRTPDEDISACYAEDFGGPLDDGEAVTRLRALLADELRLALTFTSGDPEDVELDLAIEHSSTFCLSSVIPHLSYSGELVVSRADSGEPFAVWQMQGWADYTPDGQFETLTLNAAAYLPVPFDETEGTATLGDFGVDFSGFYEAGSAVWLDYDDSGWHGHFEVQGDMEVLAAADVTEVE